MSGSTSTTFGELAKLRKDLVKPAAQLDSLPYLGLDHFKLGGGIHSIGHISEASGDKYQFSEGATLYGRLRPYFRKTIQATFDGYCSTEIWVIEPKDEKVLHPDYLPFLVHNQAFTEFAMAGAQGTKMPRAIWEHVSRFPVELPRFDVQERHAKALQSMVKLADLDESLADKLESLAILEIESAHLPLVPMATFAESPKIKTKSFSLGVVEHFSLPSFDVRKLPEFVDAHTIKSSKIPLDSPTVLVSRLNPKTPRIWMAYPRSEFQSGASTEFVLLRGRGIANELIWALCASQSFSSRLLELVTGTTGSHQRVDKAELLKVQVPDVRLLDDKTRQAIARLVSVAHNLRTEGQSVTSSKDRLLVGLLDGTFRLDEGGASGSDSD